MTETQKAISPMQELINWIDVFGFGEAQEVTRRVIRLKATQLLEEESTSLEEKDKEIERLNKTINGLLETGGSTLSVSQLAQKDSRIRELEEALRSAYMEITDLERNKKEMDRPFIIRLQELLNIK